MPNWFIACNIDGAVVAFNPGSNATNRAAPFNFDLTVPVNLGGRLLGSTGPNPGGLLGVSGSQSHLAFCRVV